MYIIKVAKLLDGPSVLLSLNLSDNQVRVPPPVYRCTLSVHIDRSIHVHIDG